MDTLNNIKKLLYKEKPRAYLVGREDNSYKYEADTSTGKVKFSIPASEMTDESGRNIIGSSPEAQLLIRWIQ